MKKFELIFLFLFYITSSDAQNQTNNWYFGHHHAITFSTNPPTLVSGGQTWTNEGSSSISDSNGNLLFYSDGINVWDSSHSIMQNGAGLLGHISSTQSALILPAPGSTNLYYLITAPVNLNNDPLAYSIIDMSLNSGLGAVTVKNIALLSSSTEKVTATYHQNGIDIWIIAHEKGNDNFNTFLLTSAGINPTPIISTLGNLVFGGIGYLKASPCGNQLAMANWVSLNYPSTLELFDFDNTTGVVSNALQLGQWNVYNGIYGVEFSPDNSRLYASIITPALVLQYNLLAGSPTAIISSMDTIGISPHNNNGALQIGPDGSMYLIKPYDSTIACILNPNQPSNSILYIEHYLSFGGFNNGDVGLPSFLSSYFCNIPSSLNSIDNEIVVNIYPNPFTNQITFSCEKVINNQIILSIKNILGQLVFINQEKEYFSKYSRTVDVSFLPSGIYLLDITIDNQRIVKKLIKA